MNAEAPATDGLSAALAALRRARGTAAFGAEVAGLAADLCAAPSAAWLRAGERLGARPDDFSPPPPWRALASAAEASQAVRVGAEPGSPETVIVAAPVPRGGGALVTGFRALSPMQVALARERLALLASLAAAETEAAAAKEVGFAALIAQAIGVLGAEPDPRRALYLAALRLASGLGVARVVLGLARRGRLLAWAVSTEESPAVGSDLARAWERVVEETLDRTGPFVAPSDDAPPAVRDLADGFGARPLAGAPARAEGDGAAGVVLVEFPSPREDAAALVESLAAALRPVLAWRAAGWGSAQRRAALARSRRIVPRVVLGVALTLGALAVVPWEAAVEAPFVAEAAAKQAVTAPFDGILAAAPALPGDRVEGGRTVLARLATRDLDLELAAARARAVADRREADIARAQARPAQEQLALLSARRAEAQVALLEYRIAQAELRAPIDGVVLSGDLRRQVGQPVSRGQVLYEVAPLEGVEVDLLVPEHRIAEVAVGQRGRLAPAAHPGARIGFVVERIAPVAEPAGGRTVVRVRARLEAEDVAAAPLKPGMEGLSRIVVGETSLLALLMREPVRLVRLWLWV